MALLEILLENLKEIYSTIRQTYQNTRHPIILRPSPYDKKSHRLTQKIALLTLLIIIALAAAAYLTLAT